LGFCGRRLDIKVSINIKSAKQIIFLLRFFGRKSLLKFTSLLWGQAVIDAVSIISLYPFVYVVLHYGVGVSSDDSISNYKHSLQTIVGSEYALLVSVAGFCLFFIVLGNLYRLYVGYFINKYTEGIRANISCFVFENFCDANLNSQETLNKNGFIHRAVVQPDLFVDQVCKPLFFAAGAVFSSCLIFVSLIVIAPFISMALISFIFFYYLIIFILFKRSTRRYGAAIEADSAKRIEFVSDAEKGIKSFLLDHRVSFIKERFRFVSDSLGGAKALYQTLQLVPSYGLEALVFSSLIVGSIVFFGLDIEESGDFKGYGIGLGVAAAALYKLKPYAHVIYQALLALRFGQNSVIDLFSLTNELMTRLPNDSVTFSATGPVGASARGGFSYGNKFLLKDTGIEFLAGENIGILGPSGSGKSTLVDLVLGLRKDKSWSTNWNDTQGQPLSLTTLRGIAAYVPQEPMLLKESIATNIALAPTESLNQKDIEKISASITLSGLESWVSKLEDGMFTDIGLGRVEPSGGQKKRLALARAIYSGPSILVLDEFTSGLDSQTSKAVVANLIAYSKNRFTIVCITHSEEDLIGFDKVFELKKMKVCYV
jgi:ABC-type multidrug transport system fused ATPase/permease subunit